MNPLVNEISLKEFGEIPISIEQITGKGEANFVFKIEISGNRYILRINGEDSLRTYEKEKWCMEKATSIGIPTSKTVTMGIHQDYSYQIQHHIEGIHGADLPNQLDKIWFTLGEYAKELNTIKVKGYGENLKDPMNDDFVNSWKSITDWEIDFLFEDNFLIKENIFTPSQQDSFKKRINELYSWSFDSVICHGNLAPKNTIIHPSGTIYLLDYGTTSAHRAIYFDLAEVLTWWDSKPNIIASFISGYGISSSQFKEMKHELETLIILRALGSIRWGYNARKNWKEVDFVQHSIKKLLKLA
jgi:fructosamine-3-kinase